MSDLEIFKVIFYSVMVALLLTPLMMLLARKLRLVDIPNSAPHKKHCKPTPLTGGWVLFGTLLVVSLIYQLWSGYSQLALITGLGVVFLFGALDDRFTLNPAVKLFGQVLAAVILISGGIQVRLFNNEVANIALTLLWLVGVTNAFNFVDSMDGLAAGLGAVTSAFFMLVTINSGQHSLSLLSMIVLGACLVCFYFNSLPAQFFLGDSGSQFLGLFLATLGLLYTPVGFTRLTSWFVPILLLGIPIFDTCLVVSSRLRRRKPVYQAQLDHTYHRLVSMGVSPNRAILTLHLAALIIDCIAFISLYQTPLIANLFFLGVLLSGVGAVAVLERGFLSEDSLAAQNSR